MPKSGFRFSFIEGDDSKRGLWSQVAGIRITALLLADYEGFNTLLSLPGLPLLLCKVVTIITACTL